MKGAEVKDKENISDNIHYVICMCLLLLLQSIVERHPNIMLPPNFASKKRKKHLAFAHQTWDGMFSCGFF